jgi:ketosteroid isomerase-like protein
MPTKHDRAWECERIRDLLARYCERLDEYDIDGVAQCFSEDAITDYGAGRGGEIAGRAAIAKRIANGQSEFRRTHHQLGQVRINLWEDGAEATSYMMTWHELTSGKKDLVCLRYLDRLRQIDGDWLIFYRRVEVTLVDGFEGTQWNWVERKAPIIEN